MSDDNKTTLSLPVEVSVKGVKTITLDLDEYELIETGTKEKQKGNLKVPVAYYKFKLIESKTK